MSNPAGMAIDPSLLLSFQQQQEQQQREQQHLSTPEKGKGRATDTAMDEDRKPSAGAAEDGEEPVVNVQDDVTLASFLNKMDEYEPILPDAVTRYYLEKAGFQTNDDRVTRLLGLAAQKFVSDIATDAYAYARARNATGAGRTPGSGNASAAAGQGAAGAGAAGAASKAAGAGGKDRSRTVLTMEDLSAAMHEYGIDASRAPYYR